MSEPMTEDRLQGIAADLVAAALMVSHHVPDLLAEVRRLRAELRHSLEDVGMFDRESRQWESIAKHETARADRLKAELGRLQAWAGQLARESADRIEALRAENERLRADLLAAADRVASQSDLLSRRAEK